VQTLGLNVVAKALDLRYQARGDTLDRDRAIQALTLLEEARRKGEG
jgi:hypothetical protein